MNCLPSGARMNWETCQRGRTGRPESARRAPGHSDKLPRASEKNIWTEARLGTPHPGQTGRQRVVRRIQPSPTCTLRSNPRANRNASARPAAFVTAINPSAPAAATGRSRTEAATPTGNSPTQKTNWASRPRTDRYILIRVWLDQGNGLLPVLPTKGCGPFATSPTPDPTFRKAPTGRCI